MSHFQRAFRPDRVMNILKNLAKAKINAFERRWNYDTSYIREIVDETGFDALAPLQALQRVSGYRRDVPPNAYYGASLTASRHADCGPCLQLGVAMAEAAGVAPGVIRAILTGSDADLPDDARLGVQLARATVARDLSGEEARAEILRRWGRRALVSLAYGIVAAQAYPTFKYAIGYGHACSRVRIAGEQLVLQGAQPA